MKVRRRLTTAELAAVKRFNELLQRINAETSVNQFETKEEQQARIKRARVDYNYFVKTYFPHYATSDCADFHVETANRIRYNKNIALLLGWGRGLAKSTHVNILIPLWLWINGDLRVMLLVGQNQEKAYILLSDLQAEFEANQLLIHDFGNQQTDGSWEEGRFVTANGCAFFALGMGQSPRGIRYRQHRPDYVVGDDLDTKEICRNPRRLRQAVAWICEDLLGVSGACGMRYIQVNNIFAPKTILTEIRDTKKGFEFIQQNATDANFEPCWPQQYTRQYYVDKAAQMGTLSFQAEYNNTPYAEGTLFTDSMIKWADCPPLESFERVIGYWDVAYSDASTADFNALKIWGLKDGKYYLIKAFVRQCKMAAVIHFMYDYQAKTDRRIAFYYEAQFWDDAMRMTIDEVSSYYTHAITLIRADRPRNNKYERIITLLPYYQQDKIIHNKAEKKSIDMQTGIAQLFGIEPGYKGHDDSPDADAAAIELLSKHVHKKQTKYIIGNRPNRRF